MSEEAATVINLRIARDEQHGHIETIEVHDPDRGYGKSTHHLLIETRTTRHDDSIRDARFTDATIEVRATYLFGDSYILRPGSHIATMGGKLNGYAHTVRLTNGSVMVGPALRGLHVGTYLFHKIVSWAKQFDASINIADLEI